MTLQRIVCYALLIAAVMVFVYSLGMVTDLYEALFNYADVSSKRKYVQGAEIYYNIQPFNKQLTGVSIALILSAVSLFVFNTHKRRKYYIGNYVTVVLSAQRKKACPFGHAFFMVTLSAASRIHRADDPAECR